jgi:hypothetical protein
MQEQLVQNLIDGFMRSPAANASNPVQEPGRRIVEDVSKIGIICSALSYAVGVVIISVYAHKYGLRTFGLAQPEYVVVGAAWMLLALILPIFAAIGILRPSMLRPAWRREGPLRLQKSGKSSTDIVASLKGRALIILLFHWLVVRLFVDTNPDWVRLGLYSILMDGLACAFAYPLPWRRSNRLEPTEVLGAILMFLFTVTLYSLHVYPFITRSLGAVDPRRSGFCPFKHL